MRERVESTPCFTTDRDDVQVAKVVDLFVASSAFILSLSLRLPHLLPERRENKASCIGSIHVLFYRRHGSRHVFPFHILRGGNAQFSTRQIIQPTDVCRKGVRWPVWPLNFAQQQDIYFRRAPHTPIPFYGLGERKQLSAGRLGRETAPHP